MIAGVSACNHWPVVVVYNSSVTGDRTYPDSGLMMMMLSALSCISCCCESDFAILFLTPFPVQFTYKFIRDAKMQSAPCKREVKGIRKKSGGK